VKREKPYTTCKSTKKRGYEDKLTALTWASRTSARGGVSRPYLCDDCGRWHLTSWPTPTTPPRGI
jgi:hypothetical protein